jgi:hypothetical protein
MEETIKVGDLVFLKWSKDDSMVFSEWFKEAFIDRTPLLLLECLSGDCVGWCVLLHPDGTQKTIHSDYIEKYQVKKNEDKD